MTKQKNYQLLINAFYEVTKVIDNTILIILGTGEQKKSLIELVEQKGLKKKVIFMGFQKNPYNFIKYSEWQTIEGLALPSKLEWYKSEGFKIGEKRNDLLFTDVLLTKDRPEDTFYKNPIVPIPVQ